MSRAQSWTRFRFKTRSYPDMRPVIFPPPGPWWCSGRASDDSYAIIIFWCPSKTRITRYWPDAFDIEPDENVGPPQWTDRFPKPDWWEATP
jgi:hypothetical protein